MPNYKEIARLKVVGQSNRAIVDFLGLSLISLTPIEYEFISWYYLLKKSTVRMDGCLLMIITSPRTRYPYG